MDPNQQPQPQPQPGELPQQPTPPAAPQPYAQPAPAPLPQPVPQQQAPQQQWQPAPTPQQQPGYPQAPSAYAAPQAPQPYSANYLDSIAPPPPKAPFLSGTFGKLFFVLIGLFVLAVSLIVAFSGQDKTADLQQMVVRLENMNNSAKTSDKYLKSSNLSNINSTYQIWLAGTKAQGEELLKLGDVKKTDYSKTMVASEKKLATDLDAKLEDARLSATLNRVYANSMTAETEKLVAMLTAMSKKSSSQKIRDYAKTANETLKQIQKDFDEYVDDGN